jgi:CheY-like chemotaxis protein/HPt (histidine-containing phosphotransfer) domain-containing protein
MDQQLSQASSNHLGQEPARQKTVLVVEDNAVNRQVAVMMLGKLGCHCDIATNGKEAVEALAKKHYQVVFMDCQMPIMDGFEATKLIRQSEMGQRQTRIVALTANAMASDREKCLAVGMDDYLSKPVKMTELADALKRSAQSPNIEPEHSEEKSPSQQVEIDDNVLFKLRETTDRETVRTVIGILRDELPNITAELELAISRHDTIGLARLAHRLKGTTGSLGLIRLQIVSQEMETAARANLLARAANLGRNMIKTFQDVIPLLENHPAVTRATA